MKNRAIGRARFNPQSLLRRFLQLALGAGIAAGLMALLSLQPDALASGDRYELRGKVVSVNIEKLRVTIAHEEIKDFMEAMTMPFAVKDKREIEALKVGDTVKATLMVEADRMWLENIRKE